MSLGWINFYVGTFFVLSSVLFKFKNLYSYRHRWLQRRLHRKGQCDRGKYTRPHAFYTFWVISLALPAKEPLKWTASSFQKPNLRNEPQCKVFYITLTVICVGTYQIFRTHLVFIKRLGHSEMAHRNFYVWWSDDIIVIFLFLRPWKPFLRIHTLDSTIWTLLVGLEITACSNR